MAELTTIEVVRDWLDASEDDDTRISLCLEAAEKKIRTLCDRTSFLRDEYTDAFDGLDWDTIILRHTPVDLTEATTLVIRISTDEDEDVEVDSTSYRIEDDTGILRLIVSPESFLSPSLLLSNGSGIGCGFPNGFRNVAITYTGGYDADDIPADLAMIAIEWASALFTARTQDPAVKAETLGDHSITYSTDVLTSSVDAQFRAELIAAGYMRPVV